MYSVSYTHLIIGMGGISTAEDALEFILAGASAVSVGTANFFNPYAAEEVVRGIEDYMKSQKTEDICQPVSYTHLERSDTSV